MFGAIRSGASAYANIGIETGVTSASPHKLVMMLFDGAMVSIASATQHMQAGDITAKGQAISKAISIIENGLRASLDKRVGGELALNLDALYSYMNTRLLTANLQNEPTMLDEVYQLLKGLRDAWEAIEPKVAATPSQEPPRVVNYDPLAPAAAQRLMKV